MTGWRLAENVLVDRGDLSGRDRDCSWPIPEVLPRLCVGGTRQPPDSGGWFYQVVTQLAQRQTRRS